MKRCTVCKQDKPLDHFSPDRRASDGRVSRCRVCRRSLSRKAYKEGQGKDLPKGLVQCSSCKDEKPSEAFYQDPRTANGLQSQCSECQKRNLRASYRRNPERYLLRAAKQRAVEKRLPFDITEADVPIPEKCPVLGIPLGPVYGRHRATSPSIDRIIPEKGYVKGNVAIISWRANSLKRDGTLEEMRKVVEWMDSVISQHPL